MGAPADVIDIVRQVDDGLWLVRTKLGSLFEMAAEYIANSFVLLSSGDAMASYRQATLATTPRPAGA